MKTEPEFYQKRALQERHDLAERIKHLEAFIRGNPLFKQLPETEQVLMMNQRDAMVAYHVALDHRIQLWKLS
jgi:hypothetical protein